MGGRKWHKVDRRRRPDKGIGRVESIKFIPCDKCDFLEELKSQGVDPIFTADIRWSRLGEGWLWKTIQARCKTVFVWNVGYLCAFVDEGWRRSFLIILLRRQCGRRNGRQDGRRPDITGQVVIEVERFQLQLSLFLHLWDGLSYKVAHTHLEDIHFLEEAAGHIGGNIASQHLRQVLALHSLLFGTASDSLWRRREVFVCKRAAFHRRRSPGRRTPREPNLKAAIQVADV